MKFASSAWLISLIFAPVFAHGDAQVSYQLLSSTRPALVFPKYSLEDKQRIADQALYLIKNYYVHRELKEKAFQTDPLAALTKLQKDAVNLSDSDLHTQLQKVFLELRDLHTNYYYPKPLSCYRSLLPFSLEKITSSLGAESVAVSRISKVSEVLALVPNASDLHLGDKLISFSGIDANTAIHEMEFFGAGANPAARFRRAMQALVYRGHKKMLPPDHDSEQLIFEKADGTRYSLVLPWVTQANQSCLGTASKKSTRLKDKIPRGQDDELISYQRFYQPAQSYKKKADLVSTKEPGIHYQVKRLDSGDFGYLQLDDFEPASESVALEIIRSLLSHEFKNTHGLIIDLRNNGGGQISYGEKLEQLFSAYAVRTEKFRLLANAANRSYLAQSEENDPNVQLIDQAISQNQTYSAGLHLTTTASANLLGEYYLQPVAILTDSGCYSTCDMFTAGMQDNKIAEIWATDGNTGGGGANVVAYSTFHSSLPKEAPNPFLALPGGQDMRVAWRQSLRVKQNEGVVLENEGVIADHLILPTLEDLTSENLASLNLIASNLSAKYEASPLKNTSIELASKGRIDFHETSSLVVAVNVSGTDSVTVSSHGKSLFSQALANSASAVPVLIALPAEIANNLDALGSLELLGYQINASGLKTRAWRKIVNIRRIPAGFSPLPGTLSFTNGIPAPLQIYSSGGPGWQIQNGMLRVGPGLNYQNNVSTEADLFLDFAQATAAHLKFTAELHSEQDYDFFKVVIVVDGVETPLLPWTSGELAQKDYDYDLSAYAGKRAEIRFVFESDSEVSSTGPFISKLSI